ncbi:hypothetical protein GCM10009779_50100 [Polymorphospora rubra]|uniref:Uncharacterized protein n=1 Tax=Polymorphospora rubra TaxID=338584 RepID=A0A810N9E1_9ACTN|nr:hypothetical protein Prubr_54490 [Polymorphospora rubra]
MHLGAPSIDPLSAPRQQLPEMPQERSPDQADIRRLPHLATVMRGGSSGLRATGGREFDDQARSHWHRNFRTLPDSFRKPVWEGGSDLGLEASGQPVRSGAPATARPYPGIWPTFPTLRAARPGPPARCAVVEGANRVDQGEERRLTVR